MFTKRLQDSHKKGLISDKYYEIISSFYSGYRKYVCQEDTDKIFNLFLDLILIQFQSLYRFSLYHKKIREPIDYYKFGLDFFRPLIDRPNSKVLGKQNIIDIQEKIAKGENVVFFANHQAENDPQAISLLLEEEFPTLGENIIYVAGERVTNDPLAVSYSMGCDLLCIYSKNYIDHPPELKHQKQIHNKKTMQTMLKLLCEGGKAIYMAPSGGRDRPNETGKVQLSSFDPKSIQMFYLMSKKATKKVHFYPLALTTYYLLPPPDELGHELGEKRATNKAAIGLSFGKEIDMEALSQEKDKSTLRKIRCDKIFQMVLDQYNDLKPDF